MKNSNRSKILNNQKVTELTLKEDKNQKINIK